jgi:RAB protein geranylgeranyltransferase component A
LNWGKVDGSYVYQLNKDGWFSKGEGGKIMKVPSNGKEALSSKMLGLIEKRSC